MEALRAADRFRFANVLSAWVDVDRSGHVTDYGYSGGGLMGATTIKVGKLLRTFEAVGLPDIQRAPVKRKDHVRFTQTAGGRTGVPAPRRVRRRPFVQWQAPLVWTTLSLTIHADGRAEGTIEGASRFPRHWVYDEQRQLAQKSGARGLQGLVPQVVRSPHTVGRRGLEGTRDRGRVGARAEALRAGDARRQQTEGTPAQGRQDARRARRSRAPRCSSCSTACCASSTTASDSRSTGRARCSASARTSTAGGEPRRSSPSRPAGSRRSRRASSIARRCRSSRRDTVERRPSAAEPSCESSSAACEARPQRRGLSSFATAGTRRVSPLAPDDSERPRSSSTRGPGSGR